MRKRERGRKSVGSHHKQRYHKRLFGIKGGKTFTKTDKTLLLGGGFEKYGFIEGKFFFTCWEVSWGNFLWFFIEVSSFFAKINQEIKIFAQNQ